MGRRCSIFSFISNTKFVSSSLFPRKTNAMPQWKTRSVWWKIQMSLNIVTVLCCYCCWWGIWEPDKKNEMFDNSLVDWPLQHVSTLHIEASSPLQYLSTLHWTLKWHWPLQYLSTLHVEASSVPKSKDLLPLTDPASGNRYKWPRQHLF